MRVACSLSFHLPLLLPIAFAFTFACGSESVDILLPQPQPGPGEVGGPDVLVSGRVVALNGTTILRTKARALVVLRDVSFADGPAPVIARDIIEDVETFPIEYTLTGMRTTAFADARLEYAVQASVFLGNDEIGSIGDFFTEVRHPVSSSEPTIDFVVEVNEVEDCAAPGSGGLCSTRSR